MRFIDLDRAGLGSLFYASAVRSMGESWHNFFYAAYDPAGTISVDKPPVALWIQVISTKLFGFSGLSIIFPIALAGTIAVPLVFGATRRSHGIAAGLLAAAILAVFPESVATARDSTMDAMVLMGLAGGAWLLIDAVEGKKRWQIVAWAALMGVVFNIKFFEGFLVLPAALVYIGWRWRDEWRRLIAPLATAAAVGLIVSFAWIAAVDLTPADNRPLVMNDKSNSELGLALRYNGIERVLPGDITVFTPLPGQPPLNSGITTAFGVGDRGPLRLIQGANGALIGFAAALALGGLGLIALRRRDWLLNGPGLFWGAWLLTGVTFFSVSNRAAAQYTESYAPAIAVLAAVGLVEAWRARGRITSFRSDWSKLLGPAMLLLLLVYGVRVYLDLTAIRTVAIGIAGLGLAAALLTAAATLVSIPDRLRASILAVAMAAPIALMLLTSLWITFEAPPSGQITRPNPIIFARGTPDPNITRQVPAEAVIAHGEGILPNARYRFAISGINDAGEGIAHTGASILPVWNNYQRVLVLEQEELRTLIRNGDLPYLLIDRRLASTGILSDIQDVARDECTTVRISGVGQRWAAWDCVPGANVARVTD